MKRTATVLAVALEIGVAMINTRGQGPGGAPSPSPGTERSNLVSNPAFDKVDAAGHPTGYEMRGNAVYRTSLGNPKRDVSGAGIALRSSGPGGSVSQTVLIDPQRGRTFSFRFRGLPQDGFKEGENGLSMKIEFFGNGGRTGYDGKVKQPCLSG